MGERTRVVGKREWPRGRLLSAVPQFHKIEVADSGRPAIRGRRGEEGEKNASWQRPASGGACCWGAAPKCRANLPAGGGGDGIGVQVLPACMHMGPGLQPSVRPSWLLPPRRPRRSPVFWGSPVIPRPGAFLPLAYTECSGALPTHDARGAWCETTNLSMWWPEATRAFEAT